MISNDIGTKRSLTMPQRDESNMTAADKHYYDTLDFIETLDPDVNARTIAIFLIKQIKLEYEDDPEKVERIIQPFKSKMFLRSLTKRIASIGFAGVIDEMAELDLDDGGRALFKFVTGETYIDPADIEAEEDAFNDKFEIVGP